MGNKLISTIQTTFTRTINTDLPAHEIEDITERTGLSLVQIELLYNQFKNRVKPSIRHVLTKADLEEIPELRTNKLGDRIIDVMFRLSPLSTGIDLHTFIISMSRFQVISPKYSRVKANRLYKSKVEFLFAIYDVDNDGLIGKDDLINILKRFVDPKLTEQCESYADIIIKEVAKSKSIMITFEDYWNAINRSEIEMKMSIPLLSNI